MSKTITLRRSTPAQRRRKGAAKKKRWRDRYYSLGLKRIEVWSHPDDVVALKEFGEAKLRARGIHAEPEPEPTGSPTT